MPSIEKMSDVMAHAVVKPAAKDAGSPLTRIPTSLRPVFHASVIVPVYNEEDTISRTLLCLSRYLGPDYELIVCNDASTDDTHDALKKLKTENPNIRLLEFHKRIGKGGSIKKAVEIANSDVIVYVDADLPASLDDLLRLVERASKTDALVISRRTLRGRLTQGALRLTISVGYNLMARLIFGTGIEDHQCGLKAMRKKVAEKLIAKTSNNRFVFDTELIVRAKRLSIPVEEIQIDWAERRPKRANTKWLKTSIEMMKDLVVLKESLP
jgi:glycosyltransferase involved in cell wall biosynthesis